MVKEKIYVAVWDTSLFMENKTKQIKSTNPGKSHIAVIDPASGKIAGKIPVGDCPMRLGITPDGRYLYVPCQMDKFLYVVDTDKDEVIKKIPVVEGMGVDFLPDGGLAYVSSSEGSNDCQVDKGWRHAGGNRREVALWQSRVLNSWRRDTR